MSLAGVRERMSAFLLNEYGKVFLPDQLLSVPYKLVDIKIVYPCIFSDIIAAHKLTEEDFVGWGDIDVIYGTLSTFIRFEENYHIIGGWHGHFTAIRNIVSFKQSFKRIPNYVELCTDNSTTFIVDEIAYRQPLIDFLAENNFKMCYINASFCDIIPPCFYWMVRPDHESYKKNFFNNSKPHKNIHYLRYDRKGGLQTVYDDGEICETSYCHLQKRKMSLPFSSYENGFYIGETGFFLENPAGPDSPNNPSKPKIRLHLPAIPYTITRDEYSHDAFTGKVKRFAPMMQSVGFEVYHYGVETSDSGADRDIQLFTVAEWNALRVESMQFLEPALSKEAAAAKVNDPATIVGTLANWNTPLFVEFNRRLRTQLIKHYRSKQTDIVCIALGQSYDEALRDLDYVLIETGIGYNNSCKSFRIFESHGWLSFALGKENTNPNNYWFVIPNFYNISEFVFRPIPEARRIGFLGRVEDVKGCHIIVEIARRFPHIQFVLCGQGNPERYVKQSNVIYKPPIHGKERSEYLGSCTAVLCLSSYLEPFCGVSVEAQLCGTPVVCTDFGAFVDNVEQFKTGLRGHTLADYCHGVQMALDGKFHRAYIRERAVRLFDMYKLAHNYEYVFRSVLDIFDSKKNGWYSVDTYIECIR